MDSRVGQQLGNYRLLHLLGRGGFADVYLGEHTSDHTWVAIKVLRTPMPNADVDTFLQEARTIALLDHPNIIRVLDYGLSEEDNTPFFAIYYAPKGTLRDRHPKGAILTPGSILPYIKQVAAALQYAHDQKLIHRDVKPENMLLGPNDDILMSDFGLAIIMQGSSYQQSVQGIDGTLAYMAPEQYLGKPRPASDQYALGVVAYEWLNGSRPFVGTVAEIQAQHLHATPQRLVGRGLEVSPAVEQVILTALTKDPHQRFLSIQDFANAFEAACSGQSLVLLRSWNMPYRRNTFFTGREEVLQRLHAALKKHKTTALTQTQAITGLGGIGKTQTAVEYAYRYRHEYRTVLWVGADSTETLFSNFASLADVLQVPGLKEQDQNRAIIAVKRWLETHTSWLLIFDNVEAPESIKDFLPLESNGHILLTTRADLTDSALQHVELEKMDQDEGTLFLLRRAGVIGLNGLLSDASENDCAAAKAIVEMLDGLPLALDQAGAYIEGTDCSLSDYHQLYNTRHHELLQERGKFTVRQEHPESVATTFSLSFAKVLQANPAAADLLRLCAFLQADAIPEEMITQGASKAGKLLRALATDQLKLDEAIGELRRYSLVRRNPETHTLSVHRLVQAILQDGMNKGLQRRWAERTVRVVNQSLPDTAFPTWEQSQRCLSHAQVCVSLIEQWQMVSPEATRLLLQTGDYLRQRGQYNQAEPFLRKALAIREQALGPDHLDVAVALDALAFLTFNQGHYAQATELYRRVWDIREKHLGPEHPDVAVSINNVARIWYFIDNTRYDECEQLLLRALAVLERTRGRDSLDVANNLANLAVLYDYQGHYAQALPLYQRRLPILEHIYGTVHPEIASGYYDMGYVYNALGQNEQALPFFQKAIDIWEAIDPEHPDIAHILNSMAYLAVDQGNYAQAESLLLRALSLHERVLGGDHHDLAKFLDSLAWLYTFLGRYAEVDSLCKRALAIHEFNVGVEHADVAIVLSTWSTAYLLQAKYAEARPLIERALRVLEQDQRPDHPRIAVALTNLADLYLAQCRYTEAEPLYKRALSIFEKVYGSENSDTIQAMYNLAKLYLAQEQYAQAEAQCRHAFALREKTLGRDHPQIAPYLNTLAVLQRISKQYDEAETLARQALAIVERVLGPHHQQVAQYLDTLADVFMAQRKYAKARPLYERALAIREQIWPQGHPEIAQSLNNLAGYYLARKMYRKAEKLCQQALDMREKLFSPEHLDVAQSLYTLANIYQEQGQQVLARPLFQRVRTIQEKILGTAHPDTFPETEY